jgi:ClpP class serine protease
MSHQVSRVAYKYLYNKPLLSTQDQLEEIVSYVENRNVDMAIRPDLAAKASEGSLGEGNIAIIPVSGALTYEETWMDAMCGMSSYQGILGMTRQAIKEGFSTCVYDMNSGGGQAYGTFECAEDIKRLTSEAGVKTIAYVDGICASACYGLAVACDEIIVNPQAEVGSVGVVTSLKNSSEKDKKEGVSYTYVYAGDSKIPYDKDGSFSESFINGLQTKVDSLYESFLTHVSSMRGIEKEAVRSTQAKMFSAEESLGIGFVDKIMTRNEFAEYLADIQEGKEDSMSLKNLNLNVNEEKEKMKIQEMQDSLDTAIAEKDTALSQLDVIKEQMGAKEVESEDLKSQLAELTSQVESLTSEKQTTELSLRKDRLSAVLGSDKVDSVFEAIKSLPEESFSALVKSYSMTKESNQGSELFNEAGVDAESEANVENSGKLLSLIRSQKSNKK